MRRFKHMTILLGLAMMLAMTMACSSGGGSGGEATANSPLVGVWKMTTTKGAGCNNCLVLTFNADGTGTYCDRTGWWLGSKTTVAITWSVSGGTLNMSGTGVDASVSYSMPNNNALWLHWEDGVEVFARIS